MIENAPLRTVGDRESARAEAPPRVFDSFLACPVCLSDELTLDRAARHQHCGRCGSEFPVFVMDDGSTVSWLFAQPDFALCEWRSRFHGFLAEQAQLIDELEQALAGTTGDGAASRRLRWQLDARRGFTEQVRQLLAPFPLLDRSRAVAPQAVLPRNQGLTGYLQNTFRDWCWQTGEVEAQLAPVLELVERTRPAGRRLLTLGGGTGRMPFELARALQPEAAVQLDLNPLLLTLAQRLCNGGRLELYEFPRAPRTAEASALLRELGGAQTLPCPQTFVAGDLMQAPFRGGAFDTLFTPWVIDILPHALSRVLPRLNELLCPGGIWLNTGTLAFEGAAPADQLAPEEVFELVEAWGFRILEKRVNRLPYLQSPASSHGRVELVYSFAAEKVAQQRSEAAVDYQPAWLRDGDQPVPLLSDFRLASSDYLLRAQVLAAIDGDRSVGEIAKALAQQYGLEPRDAEHAVRAILTQLCRS